MASMNDRRSIGQEIALRVRSTPTGVKVIQFDGTGLAEGICGKHNRRYFYGDDAEEKATEYAEDLAEDLREQRDVPVTVVELGEVMAEKLAEDGGGDE